MDRERVRVHRRGGGGDILGEHICRTSDHKTAIGSSRATVFGGYLRHLVDELFVRMGGDIAILYHWRERDAVFVADVVGFRLLRLKERDAQQTSDT